METNTAKYSDIYQAVTDKIIASLEKGIIPWKQPWKESGMPRNLISGREYRGINNMLLSLVYYKQNDFLTFRQVNDLGGKVKKGEKSHLVIFWKKIEVPDEENPGESKKKFVLRKYPVFNIEQTEGIPKDKLPRHEDIEHKDIPTCEEIVKNMPNRPPIQHIQHRAFYRPSEDFINMPAKNSFETPEGYYATLFHEMIHSTGHPSRLDRKEGMNSKSMASENYAYEELIAEIGAAYLSAHAQIENNEHAQSAAYIKSWIKRLKDDKKFIVKAAGESSKATDFVLGIQREKEILKELTPPDYEGMESAIEDHLERAGRSTTEIKPILEIPPALDEFLSNQTTFAERDNLREVQLEDHGKSKGRKRTPGIER